MCAILTEINVFCYLIYTCNAIILHFHSLYWTILLALIYLGVYCIVDIDTRHKETGSWHLLYAINTTHSVIVYK